MQQTHIWPGIVDAFCEALGLDDDEVTPESLVIDELGAESLDFLDIAFRLERTFKIKLPRGEIQRAAEQETGEAFEFEGKLTESGAAALKKALPEVPQDKIMTGYPVRDIPRLFTVQTFANLVSRQLAARIAA
jgi:acyl carrier protein